MSTAPRRRAEPPEQLPTYRFLTGPDDAEFCRRVSQALELGYKLYGSPAATFNGERVIVAQAVVWPSISATAWRPKNAATLRRGRAGNAR